MGTVLDDDTLLEAVEEWKVRARSAAAGGRTLGEYASEVMVARLEHENAVSVRRIWIRWAIAMVAIWTVCAVLILLLN